MNIAKNMEVIFIAAVALIGSASFATAGAPVRAATLAPAAIVSQAASQAASPAAADMQVVTVSAKRLSAAEKAQLAQ